MSMTSIAMKGMRAVVCTGLVLLAVSCNGDPLAEKDVPRRSVSFVVDGGAAPTRAAVTAYEGTVSSLDVLVFRSDDGMLDAHARSVSSSSVTAEVSDGMAFDWYVLANAPEGAFSGYASEGAFLAGLALLTDCTSRSLVMMGHGTMAAPSSAPVRASLDRYPCKVTLEELVVDWPDAFAMGQVSLGRVVLVNVVGSTPWSAVPAAGDLWYNRMGVDASLSAFVSDMTVKDWGGYSLSPGVAVDVASPLYCMPNPVSNGVNSANAPEWSPRSTRLAVELLIGGASNWYPIALPAMYCNKHYLIRRLTVKGPGSQGPDWPVEREDIRFTVLVEPWGSEEIPVNYGYGGGQ